MFPQVDIYLNQKCVTPANNCYNYRAFSENLLNYSASSKNSHLVSNLYIDDTPGHMDSVTDDNVGFRKRREFTVDNKLVDLYGPLHCDLFNVDKYLLGGVEMDIKLQRSKDSFHLIGVKCS